MLFLLFLYLILKVCQSRSFCLFQISLTSVCAHRSVCLNQCVWTGSLQAFFYFHSLTVQHHPLTAYRVSLGNAAFCLNVFCAACSSRGLIMLSLKAQTPPCQRLNKSHTVVSGKICFFSYFFEGLATQHKAMTNKSNKLFIVSGVGMVTSLQTDRNGIYANKLAVNAFYLKPRI